MNTGYKAIVTEYTAWLDTLGYSNWIVESSKHGLQAFLQWLEEKQVPSINLLKDKHISDYYNYLEIRPNKVHKGRLLSVAHLNKNYFAIDKLLEFLHQYGMNSVPVGVVKTMELAISTSTTKTKIEMVMVRIGAIWVAR